MAWYYWFILGLMIILTGFLWTRAVKSSREHRARIEKQTAILRHDNELKRDFRELTEEKLYTASDERLLEGVCMNIQLPLDSQTDMVSAFELLPLQKQYVYTLNYFGEDTKKGLSEFFKANGKPLITLAPQALKEIGMDEAADVSAKMLPMCDDDNEEISVDSAYRGELDAVFEKVFDRDLFYTLTAKYIKDNKDIFIRQEM